MRGKRQRKTAEVFILLFTVDGDCYGNKEGRYWFVVDEEALTANDDSDESVPSCDSQQVAVAHL
jgi:hypothetical protein